MELSLEEQEFTSPANFTNRWNSKAQYDFAGGTTKFKDVYLGLTDIPYLGKIRVGHMKEPFRSGGNDQQQQCYFLGACLTQRLRSFPKRGCADFQPCQRKGDLGCGCLSRHQRFGSGPGRRGVQFHWAVNGNALARGKRAKRLSIWGSATATGARANPVFVIAKGPRLTWRPGLWIPEP